MTKLLQRRQPMLIIRVHHPARRDCRGLNYPQAQRPFFIEMALLEA